MMRRWIERIRCYFHGHDIRHKSGFKYCANCKQAWFFKDDIDELIATAYMPPERQKARK